MVGASLLEPNIREKSRYPRTKGSSSELPQFVHTPYYADCTTTHRYYRTRENVPTSQRRQVLRPHSEHGPAMAYSRVYCSYYRVIRHNSLMIFLFSFFVLFCSFCWRDSTARFSWSPQTNKQTLFWLMDGKHTQAQKHNEDDIFSDVPSLLIHELADRAATY